ncbi:NAD(P)-binding protein [Myriangium duriaei CBS 260.36]|uniref:NAD(P)-binding protein n=1 Tax=Myriangium duriaei CBS 260.36 TaxID=1168546 RepID=A0A9P4MFW4_9PEZI|nr:NAD(P)-binding protein [Myriangium duriaei CBS 260.36]
MVSLQVVEASNARIATELPPGLVAVFTGATSGIGEYTLKAFAQHANKPRIYFVGRSQQAADRIKKECETLNPEGRYTFFQADLTLMKNVDDICDQIKNREQVVDLLFETQGGFQAGKETTENLHNMAALIYFSRTRFATNLLPLLQRSTSLRRIITVGAAGTEGPIVWDDLQLRSMSLKTRASMISMLTLSLEALAQQAPDVSFIHSYPGAVRSNLTREWTVPSFLMWMIFTLLGWAIYVPEREVGERHVFLATSAKYPPKSAGTGVAKTVALPEEVEVGLGSNDQKGSGVYLVDVKQGDSSQVASSALLAKMRSEGSVKRLWDYTQEQFDRVVRERGGTSSKL